MNILWFKRDLRLLDNLALTEAVKQGKPLLLLWVADPKWFSAPDYDDRHFQFVLQSLEDLNRQLLPYAKQIHCLEGNMVEILEKLQGIDPIESIFSHEETGLRYTWDRDKAVAHFCRKNRITWHEFPSNGVVRRLKNREKWNDIRMKRLTSPCLPKPDARFPSLEIPQEILKNFALRPLHERKPSFQEGGEQKAWAVLQDFLKNRHAGYRKSISKPEESRIHGSRLSPYLAWGNLSVRQVMQESQNQKKQGGRKTDLTAFQSRLHWHCHFIQKLERLQLYEDSSLNPHYERFWQTENTEYQAAWQNGQTGYPLIDACMRCLRETGFLNFRMRAMLISFYCHHLRQHWKSGADFLARMFLDYEPGIHFPQIQMQAGCCGYHVFRIYNPVLQAEKHDVDGEFIAQWIPELAELPPLFRREPWQMTEMEKTMYKFELGKHYPERLVVIEHTGASARHDLHAIAARPDTRQETDKILRYIVRPPKSFDEEESLA